MTVHQRYHIVLAPKEKRRWTSSAAAAGLPTSEYVRHAVEAYADDERLTPEQLRQLEAAMDEAVAAAQRFRADVAKIREIVSRPFDEDVAFDAGFAAAKASGFKLDFSHLRRGEAA